jgi:hypothetical protein
MDIPTEELKPLLEKIDHITKLLDQSLRDVSGAIDALFYLRQEIESSEFTESDEKARLSRERFDNED